MPTKPKGIIKKGATAKGKTSVAKKSGSGLKGVIKKVSGVASKIPGVAGVVGGVVNALVDSRTGDVVSMGGRKRHKGLTYREIKGATKVLKLVKKFAPSGSKFKLKSRRTY